MTPQYLQDIFESGRHNVKSKLIYRLLGMVEHAITAPLEPSWAAFNSLLARSSYNFLTSISWVLLKNGPEGGKNVLLWEKFLQTLVALICSPIMGINSKSFQRSFFYHNFSRDLGLNLINLLRNIIFQLREIKFRQKNTPVVSLSFLRRLLGVCFIEDSLLPHFAIEMMSWIAEAEFDHSGNFRSVQSCFITAFHDAMVLRIPPDVNLDQCYAIQAFRKLMDKRDGKLGTQVQKFFRSLYKLAPLIKLPGGEIHCENDAYNACRILRYLRTIKHLGLFVYYIHALYQYHLKNKNYIEAAMTLYLETTGMAWRSDKVPDISAISSIPNSMSEFELNEQVHITCIKLLGMGQSWERAIELTRVLENRFENQLMDFQKLAEILRIRVTFLEKVFNTHRTFAHYYRVYFHGEGFPLEIREKTFVYRGDNWEQIGTFCERLEREYVPDKVVITKKPLELLEQEWEGLSKVIQVTALDPVPDIRKWALDDFEKPPQSGAIGVISWSVDKLTPPNVDNIPVWLFNPELFWEYPDYQVAAKLKQRIPQNMNQYYEQNEVSMFSFSRPYLVGVEQTGTDVTNEIANLWIEKTVLFTETPLPFVTRSTKAIQKMVFKISPIENAISAVRKKTKELVVLKGKYKSPAFNHTGLAESHHHSEYSLSMESSIADQAAMNIRRESVNPFTMELSGAADSPVNGGINHYRNAFLNNPDFSTEENKPDRETLQNSILDYVHFASLRLK
jgi:hypothetical protein